MHVFDWMFVNTAIKKKCSNSVLVHSVLQKQALCLSICDRVCHTSQLQNLI